MANSKQRDAKHQARAESHAPDGWTVVAALAEADARITAASHREIAKSGLKAIRQAQACERELQAYNGINMLDVFAEAIERFEIQVSTLTERSQGATASDRRVGTASDRRVKVVNVAMTILRGQGFSGAAVARALDPEQAGNSARSTRGKRTTERRGTELHKDLTSRLDKLRDDRRVTVDAGAELLAPDSPGEASDEEIGRHLRAQHVQFLDEEIDACEATRANLERPQMEAQRSPFTVERGPDGGPPVKKRAPADT